jgi:hypothetical protein
MQRGVTASQTNASILSFSWEFEFGEAAPEKADMPPDPN